MSSRLDAITFDANDPVLLGRFWAGVLQRELADDPDQGTVVPPGDHPGPRLRFVPTTATKDAQNLLHFDLTSTSLDDQRETVERALRLGGRRIDIGQDPDDAHDVLADPEGNEFCVIEPDNSFLAGCGPIGALSCDGSRQVGNFWSAALDWPLVWDEGEETAVQSPRGGPKITWGGPPYMERPGKNRLHLDLVADEDDLEAEVGRLLALGATTIDIGQGSVAWTVMADPDGNEFCVWPTPAR
jgi:predicted enzyme related to lactoylglutathione lyase